jgi:DNA-directed RNA polymerase subunit RPC12/RpoP
MIMLRYFCHHCLRATEFNTVVGFDEGSQAIECSQCGSRFLAHSCCQQRPTYQQPNLLPIAVGAMGVVCPECKVLYQLSQEVGKCNPSAGAAIATLAFVIFGIVALDRLAGKKRR